MGNLNVEQSPVAKFREIVALDTVLFDAMNRLQRLGLNREASQLQEIRTQLAAPMNTVQPAAYEAMGAVLVTRRTRRRK